tara:strand:- start:862 stop:1620 length:759 start_codon:yes stop_codon:yes gene_type:complete
LWEAYNLEKFKESSGTRKRKVIDTTVFKKPVFKNKKKIDLPRLSELNKQHPAREYLTSRGIPEEKLSKFYFAEKFKAWTNSLKHTYDSIDSEESRIVIPLLDEEGNLFGYQGRSLQPKDKLRYVTVMLSDDVPKIYGLDEVEKTSPVYVTEGPLDSNFLANAIAMCGSDVDLRNLDYQFVFVFDNEPRNKQIVEKITRAALNGDKVVIWPSSVKEKDINDMVLGGHNVENVVKLNTYQGLEAQVKLSEWKRV